MRTCSFLWIIYLLSCLIPDAYKTGEPVMREDINRMTAGYLTSPVEPAFNAWQERPWKKQIPFDAFCEEIRPCRAGSVLYHEAVSKAPLRHCERSEAIRNTVIHRIASGCAPAMTVKNVEPFNKTQPEQGNPWKNETPKELMPP
jgi:hypothetical protein